MTFGRLFSRHAVAANLSKVNGRALASYSSGYGYVAKATTNASPSLHTPGGCHPLSSFDGFTKPKLYMLSGARFLHGLQEVSLEGSSHYLGTNSEEDGTMNEFLSRFVWIMRKKLKEAYPDLDKDTVDGMLVIIVGRVASEMEKGTHGQMGGTVPSHDFSEDLWRAVWDVSNVVLKDMEREKKKEKMKSFLQSEEVKEKYRFAGEIGIRGDMLRELRFKWAREKMEETEFYEGLEQRLKEGAQRAQQKKESGKSTAGVGVEVSDNNIADEGKKIVSLPKRHGNIKFNIYGLDLSDPKWAEVADKIHESGEVLWPKEPKPLSGKCKAVTDKILSLQEGDDPTPLIGEWTELVQPSRVDWISLLERLNNHKSHLYFKVAELLLTEKSFEANIRDYSKLIDSLANEDHLEDAERILKKMNESGLLPDVIMSSTLIHMYCKSGNIDQAKESFERLKVHGFQPDVKVYHSMIMAYVNAGQPRLGESLAGEMTYANAGQSRLGESMAGETETSDTKLLKEIYTALLQSFAQRGDLPGAERIFTAMEYCGLKPSLESSTLMVEACARADEPDRARVKFDQMRKLDVKPDDKCIAHMLAAYEKRNFLDDALSLLLELEKDGVEPGVAAYTVMVDWLSKLGLYDEAEQILDKIAELGEAPPLKLHTSLCDMYIKSGNEKKALQSLGVLESRYEQLELGDFERIIGSLTSGGYVQDVRRMHGLMEGRGFGLSEDLKIKLMASETLGKGNKSNKSSLLKDK